VTALQGLRHHGDIGAGQAVLVNGASGGVGHFAVQLARHRGARVIGTASAGNLEFLKSIGADEVIDYTREDIAEGTRRYDVIFDTAGNREVSDLRQILTPKGTLVLAGGEGGGRWLGMGRVMKAKAISPFVGQRMTNFLGRAKTEDLLVLKDLIEAGKVKALLILLDKKAVTFLANWSKISWPRSRSSIPRTFLTRSRKECGRRFSGEAGHTGRRVGTSSPERLTPKTVRSRFTRRMAR
jgi:threonine dehydrogenase-like Zn-dependent dehydrogenase